MSAWVSKEIKIDSLYSSVLFFTLVSLPEIIYTFRIYQNSSQFTYEVYMKIVEDNAESVCLLLAPLS